MIPELGPQKGTLGTLVTGMVSVKFWLALIIKKKIKNILKI